MGAKLPVKKAAPGEGKVVPAMPEGGDGEALMNCAMRGSSGERDDDAAGGGGGIELKRLSKSLKVDKLVGCMPSEASGSRYAVKRSAEPGPDAVALGGVGKEEMDEPDAPGEGDATNELRKSSNCAAVVVGMAFEAGGVEVELGRVNPGPADDERIPLVSNLNELVLAFKLSAGGTDEGRLLAGDEAAEVEGSEGGAALKVAACGIALDPSTSLL